MTEEDKNQPIIAEDAPFIVKVKLLSSEVYEIATQKDVGIDLSRF